MRSSSPPDLSEIEISKITPRIDNVVATFSLETTNLFRLKEIASKCGNSEYNPNRFNGAIMRFTSPKSTLLIFRNGKVVMVGMKSENDARICSRKLMKKLNKIGMCNLIVKKEVEINNVVGTVQTRFRFNLDAMHMLQNSQYQPNTFPGLIYRMKNPKSTFLVFTNGKIVINGAKNEQDIYDAFNIFYYTMKKYHIIPKSTKNYDNKQLILI